MRKQHGNDPRDYDRCTTLSISFLSLRDTLHFSYVHVLTVNLMRDEVWAALLISRMLINAIFRKAESIPQKVAFRK